MAKAVALKEPGNEVPAVNEAEVPKIVKVTLPADLYALYESLASAQDLSVSELILHRLQRCAGHSSIRNLYFHESQLRTLENLLQKRPIDSADQALIHISRLISFRIGDFDPIQISAEQAKRIHLGAYGGITPQDKLRTVVQAAVAKATGI